MSTYQLFALKTGTVPKLEILCRRRQARGRAIRARAIVSIERVAETPFPDWRSVMPILSTRPPLAIMVTRVLGGRTTTLSVTWSLVASVKYGLWAAYALEVTFTSGLELGFTLVIGGFCFFEDVD